MTARMSMTQRRAHLTEAALTVATTEGIAATTVRRVAEQAGVALGVVHYCFADKDELFVELAARIVDDLVAAGAGPMATPAPAGPLPELGDVLAAALDGLWAGIEASPGPQLLTYEITTHALRQPGLAHVARRQYEASHAAVLDVLGLAAAASGARWLDPVDDLAGQVLAFIDGVTLRWLVDGDSAAARSRLTAFLGYLVTRSRPARRRRPAGDRS